MRKQPARLIWPLTPSQMESVDEMFYELYKRVGELSAGVAAVTPAAPSTGISSTGLIVGGLPLGFGSDGEDGVSGIPGTPGAKGATGDRGPALAGSDGDDGASLVVMLGAPNGSELTLTTTGNIDDLNFGNVATLRMNNATLATIRGLQAGYPGQRIAIISVGAGEVDLAHQDANSVATNRLINVATSTSSPLAPGAGRAEYEYDATTGRWRLLAHDQGAVIAYTPTWSNSATAPVLGNGTLTGAYFLHGRFVDVYVTLVIGSTSTFGTGNAWYFSIPVTLVGACPICGGFVTSVGGTIINPNITTITAAHAAAGEVVGILTATAANVNETHPAGMTTGDVLRWSVFNYPIA